MANFTKTEENYIEHEVQLRVYNAKFEENDKAVERLDASLKHLDNKLMLMFSIVLGSIWLPAILHYLHVA
jgi:hypothetical protein